MLVHFEKSYFEKNLASMNGLNGLLKFHFQTMLTLSRRKGSYTVWPPKLSRSLMITIVTRVFGQSGSNFACKAQKWPKLIEVKKICWSLFGPPYLHPQFQKIRLLLWMIYKLEMNSFESYVLPKIHVLSITSYYVFGSNKSIAVYCIL